MGLSKSFQSVLCAGAALALLFSLDIVVNSRVFPLFYYFAPFAKDIATVAGAIALLVIALVALKRPFPFVTFAMGVGFAAAAALGLALIVMGTTAASAPVTVTGAILFSVGGRTVVLMYACFALVALNRRQASAALLGALIAQYPLGALAAALPLVGALGYVGVAPFAALVLARKGGAGSVLSGQGKQPLADLSIANPRSFLPFSSIVFLTFGLFNIATGCQLTYLAEEGIPQSTASSLVLLAVLAVLALCRRPLSGDTLVKLSCLFILTGFLLVPLTGLRDSAAQALLPLTPGLFSLGSSLLTLVFYLVFSEIGRRNRFGAVPLFAFGYAVIRFGFAGGALLGSLMNENESTAVAVSVAMAFIFAAYGILLLGKVSFRDLIDNVRAIPEPSPDALPASAPLERDLAERCEGVIADFGLTPRESEILTLLAQGRSIAVIQDGLVVSRNTVKTHVKNIYAKLDVHSQQELIDVVRRY